MSSMYVTFISGVALAAALAWLAIADKVPAPTSTDKTAGCSLVSSLKTDELRYCGKACWASVYVNTYQCPTGKKVLVQ